MSNLIVLNYLNKKITAIEYKNQAYIPMRPLVDYLGLRWEHQSVDISNRFPASAQVLGVQSHACVRTQYLCLPLTKLPAFLHGLDARTVKPDLQADLKQFQQQADEALSGMQQDQFCHDTFSHLIDPVFNKYPLAA